MGEPTRLCTPGSASLLPVSSCDRQARTQVEADRDLRSVVRDRQALAARPDGSGANRCELSPAHWPSPHPCRQAPGTDPLHAFPQAQTACAERRPVSATHSADRYTDTALSIRSQLPLRTHSQGLAQPHLGRGQGVWLRCVSLLGHHTCRGANGAQRGTVSGPLGGRRWLVLRGRCAGRPATGSGAARRPASPGFRR